MSWDKQKSLDRIQRRWEARDTEITVSKLARDMNLENVTLRNGRRIEGAHVYATVAASGQLHCLDTDEHARSAIQRTALWQAEVARIAKAFDVPIVAFQGARVHLLTYRPIDNGEAIARKATLLARAITFMTRDAFNPLFDEDLGLKARAAADLGETVATRGGTRGDAELLFLGNAANRPAKLLSNSKLVVTGRFLDALGDQLEHEKIEADGEDAWIVRVSADTVEAAVADDDGIDWSIETSADRLAADVEKWPTERFKVSGASELIKPSDLSRSNSKLVNAAVVLMDIDGFSAYVDEAENDTVKRDAILTIDAIRQEMREILKVDYNGVRIQYQGDNMIGLIHLPADDEKIATGVTDIAAGMQSSMSITLPDVVPDANRLDGAVGIAMDDTVVACLGQYAKRNALVLGPAATEAEKIQMRLDGKQTGIDITTYEALPEAVQDLFNWNANAKAYVAEDLSAAKLSRVQEALSSNGQRTLTPDSRGRFHIGTSVAVTEHTRRVRPFRPYAE